MKNTIVVGGKMLIFAVVFLLLSGYAKAQSPVVYHPGQSIRITIKFDGPDAGKIKSAVINLHLPAISESQPGFSAEIYGGESNPVGPNTFEVSFKIPETQASGDYQINQIRAIVNVSGSETVTLFYNSPTDFPAGKTFTVENPNSIVKPEIKSITVP